MQKAWPDTASDPLYQLGHAAFLLGAAASLHLCTSLHNQAEIFRAATASPHAWRATAYRLDS